MPRRPTVALVTAATAHKHDDDLPPLLDALAALGVEGEVVAWDDPSVDWVSFDLAAVRSTWNYTDRLDDFLAWVDRAETATVLLNPPAVLRWNTDKQYLRDLEQRGVPIVPTVFVDSLPVPGAPMNGDVVVKPTVSAGARDTSRYSAQQSDDRDAHVGRLVEAGRVAMVQPYIDAIDTEGETALVYIDGEFSHGLRKAAILAETVAMVDGLYAAEKMSARSPRDAEQEVADRVLAAAADALGLDEPLLYARIDLVPGPASEPLLLELELTEPSLFLAHGPGGAERFATAVVRRLGGP